MIEHPPSIFAGFAVLTLVATGCVTDAPENLEELLVYGFVNFDDDAAQKATIDGLLPLKEAHEEALTEGFRVDELSQQNLTDAGQGATIESGIVGSAATVQYTSDVDQIAGAWSYEHMEEVIETTVAYDVREETGDRNCFIDRECPTYSISAWRQNTMGIFGTSEQEFERNFRWVETNDGVEALMIRELVPDGAEMTSAIVAVHQQFSYSVLIAESGGTERLDTFWIDAEVIGADLPDAWALDMAVSSMTRTAEDVDQWITENGD